MSATILITGHSQGLGEGLCQEYLDRGQQVVGVARRAGRPHEHLQDVQCDLADLESISATLAPVFQRVDHWSTVFLNAGVLGEIKDLADTDLASLKAIMDLNLWANKLILDGLIQQRCRVEMVIMISSGAAVNGSRGWGGYALSKAALNMLAQLYAHEMPDTHVVALAPGLVDTSMQDYLCQAVDTTRFPSVARLAAARHTDAMPDPRQAARQVIDSLEKVRSTVASGGFVDIRHL
jgi:NAD(P)-dependent dehydrogenase (short-subunit alcohol dehydrogenase family)